MSQRIVLLVLCVFVVGLLGGRPAWAGDDPEAAPVLDFVSSDLIQRDDGTVLYFYRTEVASAKDLVREMTEIVRVPDVAFRVAPRLGLVVVEGRSDAVEVAVQALAYLDVSPPQVRVEARFFRARHWTDEAPEEGDDAEGAEGAAGKGAPARRGRLEMLSHPFVVVAQGAKADVSQLSKRPSLVPVSANGGGVNLQASVVSTGTKLRVKALHIGPTYATLEVEVSVEEDEPTSRLLLPTGQPTTKYYSLKTSLVLRDGQTVVLSGLKQERSVVGEGDAGEASLHQAFGLLPVGQSEASAQEKIEVELTVSIVKRTSTAAVPRNSEEEKAAVK